MKRTALALTLILALLVSGLAALAPVSGTVSEESQLEWIKTFGYISGVSIVQANDGDLVVAADAGTDWFYNLHARYDYSGRTGALLKIDLNGDGKWRQQLPLDPVTLIETDDDGFAVAGWTRKLVWEDAYFGRVYSYFVSLAKTDAQGNVLWSHTYTNLTQVTPNNVQSSRISVNSALQTQDGGFVLGGYQWNASGYKNYYKAWLMKTDSSGNMLWINYYGDEEANDGTIQNSVQKVVETADNGFLFAGYLDGAVIVKTDSMGKIQWTKTYDNIRFHSMLKTKEGNFVFAGYQGEYEKAYVMKLDAAYNTMWNRTYENYSAFSIKASADDGYLFTSYIHNGKSLIKTDLEGNIKWTYKSEGSISSAIQTKDGAYALTGNIKDPDAAGKTMSEGDITDIMVERLASKPSLSITHSPEIPDSISLIILLIAVITALLVIATLFSVLLLRKRKRATQQSRQFSKYLFIHARFTQAIFDGKVQLTSFR
jgi:hypothetical protein